MSVFQNKWSKLWSKFAKKEMDSDGWYDCLKCLEKFVFRNPSYCRNIG